METKTAKKTSFARFYVLLSQMPGVDKEDLVWQYSGLLTTSLREFYDRKPADYARMINDMEKAIFGADRDQARVLKRAELKRLRSAVLHRLQKHGIDTTDWRRVNAFMRQPRIAGKTLGEMSSDELYALIPKLESILTKDAAKRNRDKHIAQLN